MEGFLNSHELQLYSIGFPLELYQTLYRKLLEEDFDAGAFFKIFQKVDQEDQLLGYDVRALRDLHPNSNVFLIDHSWSFRLPEMRSQLSSNQNLLARVRNIVKLIGKKMELPETEQEEEPCVFVEGNIDRDGQGLECIEDVPEGTILLSLRDNNFRSLDSLFGVLNQLKALWLNENPVSEQEEKLFALVEAEYTNIELLNRKFTVNASEWAMKFVCNKLCLEEVSFCDVSGRGVARVSTSILNFIPNVISLDLTDNQLNQQWILCLSSLKIKKLLIDEIYAHQVKNPSIKYLNGLDTTKGQPRLQDITIQKIWGLLGSYRLSTETTLDQSSIWYLMDQLGTSILHSDIPNVALHPFLFTPTEGDPISYSLLWPTRPIRTGEILFKDTLLNISQQEYRSYRLYCWFKINTKKIKEQYSKWKNLLGKNPPPQLQNFISQQNDFSIPLKVYTDLDFFQSSLTDQKFSLVSSPEQAQVVWTREQLIEVQSKKFHIQTDQYINQFPFQSCIVMKNLLAHTVQRQAKIDWFPLTFDLNIELPAFMGEYFYRAENGLDNHWILKPINMARGMDCLVSNNLDQIIRMMETGPKIAQKYVQKPLLLNKRKFDLRYIVLLKSVEPFSLLIHDKFFTRIANRDFNLKYEFNQDYETHFTVMNYANYDLQRLEYDDFISIFDSEHGSWAPVQMRINSAIKELFGLAVSSYEMQSIKSRAVYGIDLMLDSELNIYILEVNFCPDCQRAVQYYPSYTNEIFDALFFGELVNVSLL